MIEVTAGGDLASEAADVLVLPVLADRSWGPGADWLAEELGDYLVDVLDDADFQGKAGTTASVPTRDRLNFKRVLLIGLGSDPDLEQVRRGAGTAGKKTTRDATVATTLHQLMDGAAGAAAEGFLLGQYRFDRYQSEKKPLKTEELRFVGAGADDAAAQSARSRVVVDAVTLARDLINEPPGAKPPVKMVAHARRIAEEGGLELTVYEPDQFEGERFGGLAGVAAGSHAPAAMVVLRYEPEDPRGFIALVGKGIIFDSGGLSLKPPAGMEAMKTDMSGAAAVLGTMQAVAALAPPVRVVAITPFTENMPGGGAQRPGDVLTPRNGTTVEVLNTDAEGRLILADALSLAAEEEPDLIVDIATRAALRQMVLPGSVAILAPVTVGFVLGPAALAGMLAGAVAVGASLSLFMANAGGAWDNAKKFIEAGGLEGHPKGSETHKAAVIGDTVGDPFKDTSGPGVAILIKVMSVVSLLIAPLIALQ